MSRIVKKLGVYKAAAELAARMPWEWQGEAAQILAGLLPRPLRPPPELEAYVAQQRAEAQLAVRQASAILCRDATRRAQQATRGNHVCEARYYAAVTEAQVLAQIDPTLLPILALGPSRRLRKALHDAAALLPEGQLWHDNRGSKKGWRSLGEAHPNRRVLLPQPLLSAGAARKRAQRGESPEPREPGA